MNDTEQKAEEIRNRGSNDGAEQTSRKRGRPPGSKNRPKDGNTTNSKTSESGGEGTPFLYTRDENNIKATALMGATAWYFAAKMLPNIRALKEDEAMALGEALDPVLQKYLPVFGEWKYELNLVMVVVGLYQACQVVAVKEVENLEETNADSNS